jgi:hypothetical protein
MLGAEPGRGRPGQDVVVDGAVAVLALAVGALVEQGEGTLHVGELLLDGVQERPVDVEFGHHRTVVDTGAVVGSCTATERHGVFESGRGFEDGGVIETGVCDDDGVVVETPGHITRLCALGRQLVRHDAVHVTHDVRLVEVVFHPGDGIGRCF